MPPRVSARSPNRPTKPGRRGRPATHDEPWIKVSVVLFRRQVRQLDQLTAQIRRTNAVRLTRAELIRALIDALIESRLDLTTTESGADVKRILVDRLSGPATQPH